MPVTVPSWEDLVSLAGRVEALEKRPVPGSDPEPPVEDGVYTVQAGDNLVVIAAKMGVTWQALYEANRDVIGPDPAKLYPGQRLVKPGDQTSEPPPPPPPPPATGERGALRPMPAWEGVTVTASTKTEAVTAIANAKAGDTVLLLGDLGDLEVEPKNSGTPDKWIRIVGDGNTRIGKLDLNEDYLYAAGFDIIEPNPAPGIVVRGNHITVEHCVVDSPSGGDGDCVRFFGGFLTFRNLTLKNTDNDEGHADAFQNYSTQTSVPETHDVLIENCLMENIANIGVISEGPHSSYGDGSEKGNTYKLVIRNNYIQANSAQSIWLDDVQDWVVEGNTFDGGVHHAIGVTNKSTGGTVKDNEFINIKHKVGMDKSSRVGYTGPEPTTGP